MKIHRSFLLVGAVIAGLTTLTASSYAQPSVQSATEYIRKNVKREIIIPDVNGMKVLKCDFHMHTIFSDGSVWPTVRVDEAAREGLDAIAITDHIEGHPSKTYVGGDHNSSYDIALPHAQARDIILVRGAEVTRSDEGHGHFNAIFLKDANALDQPDFFKVMETAAGQGAFIFWNHPFSYIVPGKSAWAETHETLVAKGWLHGVEAYNELDWYPEVLNWCATRNLAVVGNTDIHEVVSEVYDTQNGHRPMTLVFAKERSEASLKEAMFARNTAIWFGDHLAGPQALLEALFKACVSCKITPVGENNYQISFTNQSSIPFLVESTDPMGPGHLWLAPLSTRSEKLPYKPSGKLAVTNLHTEQNKCLECLINTE